MRSTHVATAFHTMEDLWRQTGNSINLHDQAYIVKESTRNHTQTQWVRYTGKNIQLVQNEELKAEIDKIMKCILVMTFLMEWRVIRSLTNWLLTVKVIWQWVSD